MCGIFTRDYAGATYTAIPLSSPTPLDSVRHTGFSLNSLNPLAPLTSFFEKTADFFDNLPRTIAETTISLMARLYELCASLILKTPIWIFDNDWFRLMSYQFSAFSLGIVTVLTTVEAIKRMLSGFRGNKKQPMEMKKIFKRWGLVSLALSGVPFLFHKSFQALNYVSEKVISMGGNTMRTVSLPENIQTFDVITLVLFNIALIATIIPVLLANGKRFFDIMLLGVVTPFALSAWIFDPYKHLFQKWWSNLKRLSFVQVQYSLFLLVLGWFIFGVPTPETFTGIVIKLLVVIGGFSRMADPPRFIDDSMNAGEGLDDIKAGFSKTKKSLQNSKRVIRGVIGGPTGIAKEVVVSMASKNKVVNTATRMGRIHGK